MQLSPGRHADPSLARRNRCVRGASGVCVLLSAGLNTLGPAALRPALAAQLLAGVAAFHSARLLLSDREPEVCHMDQALLLLGIANIAWSAFALCIS